jgi:hypothetical protein
MVIVAPFENGGRQEVILRLYLLIEKKSMNSPWRAP